ncbi:hypothetical protein CANCADRAFT_81364 [Tortispora caseinolytica NRRL Y-17796]|uniref:Nuclear control of ATPase protein 2 n=1 Tax=Tortispora caseinolytica NRRL Y-17796 TaxID=767744 RepID=A0A1E4TJT9_9ASCO|nr:hypothetical protein CANCADRAFT_81364 [Tortispora caseinolytica NRRL Y-17796]
METLADERIRALTAQLEFCTPVLPRIRDSDVQARLDRLKTIQHRLTSKPSNLVALPTLVSALKEFQHASLTGSTSRKSPRKSLSEAELAIDEIEWVLVGTAAISLYGNALNLLLDRTLPVSEDIYYWDQVLSMPNRLIYYSLQTAPLRGVQLAREVFTEARTHVHRANAVTVDDVTNILSGSLWAKLKKWFHVLKETIICRKREMMSAIPQGVAPWASLLFWPVPIIRKEIHLKRRRLRTLLELQAASLGYLVDSGIDLDATSDWRRAISDGVESIGEMVEATIKIDEVQDIQDFISNVMPKSNGSSRLSSPFKVAERIIDISSNVFPTTIEAQSSLIKINGKPSFMLRHWPTLLIMSFSGSSILKFVTNRQAELKQWIFDIAGTLVDFWQNWVIEPVKGMIRTIRHIESNRIALISKQSLTSDMQSLERMVVDFAIEKTGADPASADIELLRDRVHKGDLSLVLQSYETDIKRPIKGTISGDLLRTLLIQMQKTKVDVELAMTGIDDLLQSQSLLFGALGASPSLIVTYLTFKWIYVTVTGRGIRSRSRDREKIVITLRAIERSTLMTTDSLSHRLPYHVQGLILCNVHVLRSMSNVIKPSLRRCWVDDLRDLENINLGASRQKATIERIWRMYI